MRRLSLRQARRAAIAAQELASPRPSSTPNLGHVQRTIRRLSVLQIDSVNVVRRAHHLTLFTRLGAYDTRLLWRALEERRIFEYWARMASFAPMEDYPLYRHRMDRLAQDEGKRIRELNASAPGYVESVYEQVAERGPVTVADLEEPGERRGPWWGWADGKIALEHLFAAGRITVAHRRNFTRYYDIVERVVPAEYLEAPSVDGAEARRRLLLLAARALGIGTIRDISGYFRLRADQAAPVLADLAATGSLVEVEVAGWSEAAYLHPAVTIPRKVDARALVNPFDTYMWNRERIERLHAFSYRIEIYVPRPKRAYGYYVFPFLLGDELVARVDLKADRGAGVLRVPGAFMEDGADPLHVAQQLAVELREMAGWLGLDDIVVGERGDLTPHLRNTL